MRNPLDSVLYWQLSCFINPSRQMLIPLAAETLPKTIGLKYLPNLNKTTHPNISPEGWDQNPFLQKWTICTGSKCTCKSVEYQHFLSLFGQLAQHTRAGSVALKRGACAFWLASFWCWHRKWIYLFLGVIVRHWNVISVCLVANTSMANRTIWAFFKTCDYIYTSSCACFESVDCTFIIFLLRSKSEWEEI